MPAYLTADDAKELLQLCRAGRLYDIEKWVAFGKSIQVAPEVKNTPLQIAIDSGFHRLVDLLARHESRPESKNDALALAVSKKRLDFVELLVAQGARRIFGTRPLLLAFGIRQHPRVGEYADSQRYDVRETFERVTVLVTHGALWRPEPKDGLNSLRKTLYECEPAVTVDLVKLLARYKAAAEETLEQLLDAPRMKQHLSALGMKLFGGPSVGRSSARELDQPRC